MNTIYGFNSLPPSLRKDCKYKFIKSLFCKIKLHNFECVYFDEQGYPILEQCQICFKTVFVKLK